MTQNLCDAIKAVLRGKFVATQSKLEKELSNNLTLCQKQLQKEEGNPKVGRRKEIIKIRAEIYEKNERNNSKD